MQDWGLVLKVDIAGGKGGGSASRLLRRFGYTRSTEAGRRSMGVLYGNENCFCKTGDSQGRILIVDFARASLSTIS